MKSVLISIRPEWCEKIANGKKTIEVRKSAPKEVPFKAYIYATRPKKFYKCGSIRMSDEWLWLANGKVEMGDSFKFWANGDKYQGLTGRIIGEFICDKVYNLVNAFGGIVFADENLNQLDPQLFRDMSCLTDEQTADYLGDKDGYGLHITDLKIYGKPKELSEFFTPMGKRPSYMLERPPQSYMFVEEIEKC